MAADAARLVINMYPAMELVRRILATPDAARHASHVLAMIADGNLLEIGQPAPGDDRLRALPSVELLRLARAAGVIAE